MPGLAIILSGCSKHQCASDLNRMIGAMCHEPTYTVGTYIDESLGLYVAWVRLGGNSSEETQLRSADGRWLLFFYGEHRSSERRALPSRGDFGNARIVLRLFEERGFSALKYLNGWFYGVAVDLHQGEVAVFNDRFGMQRLHVHDDGTGHFFAGEARALLAVRPRLRALDPQSLCEFLTSGCVLENRSLFQRVTTLPAATLRIYNRAILREVRQYFDPDEWEAQTPLDEKEFLAQAEQTLAVAVERCVGPDCGNLGVSLTGGYDTRLIMACLSAARRRVPCYTFGGPYRESFDVKIGREVAKVCGLDHQVLALNETFFKEFPTSAAKTVLLSDGCLGATNAYELFLNQRARDVALIRLTGSFGSEVMRGARAFKAVLPAPGLLSPDLKPYVNSALRTFALNTADHPVSFSVFKHAPWLYYNRLAVEQSQVIVRTPYMDNDFVELFYRRPSSVGDGRRLAEELVLRIAPALAALPTDTGNCSLIRQQWMQFLFKADYLYKSGMPQWLEQLHHALGQFQPERLIVGTHRFAHFRIWFRRELAWFVKELLLDPRTQQRGFFNRSRMTQIVEEHLKGVRNFTDEIERMITVELICRQFLDR
jgi:asparagine synthase (glutamine-hydrolysing)